MIISNKFPMFLNDWSEEYIKGCGWKEGVTPLHDMANDFSIKLEELESVNILVASYTYEHYSGDAFVLFEKDGKLYEVNGGHCSCYGLEGQWEPEEAMLDELHYRIEVGNFGRDSEYDYLSDKMVYNNVFADELIELIDEITKA